VLLSTWVVLGTCVVENRADDDDEENAKRGLEEGPAAVKASALSPRIATVNRNSKFLFNIVITVRILHSIWYGM